MLFYEVQNTGGNNGDINKTLLYLSLVPMDSFINNIIASFFLQHFNFISGYTTFSICIPN